MGFELRASSFENDAMPSSSPSSDVLAAWSRIAASRVTTSSIEVACAPPVSSARRCVLPRLPGDLTFGRGNLRVFVPIGTSILISVVLTILLNLFLRR